MAKPKKKANREEKLAKDRLRKKEKYAEIKKDPEKYRLEKEKQKKAYLLRKEKKKIIGIKDMTERQKRDQRRRWRMNTKKYLNKVKEQKKLHTILLENSPPDSEAEITMEIPVDRDPLIEIDTSETTPKTVQQNKNRSASSALRRLRYRSIKIVSNLQREIDKLKKEKNILKTQLNRDRQFQKEVKQKHIQDTIEKKVDQAIEDIKADKIEEVKKKLLFNETINKGVSEKYEKLSKKDKRPFIHGILDDSRLKKYGILSNVNFNLKKKLTEKRIQANKTAKIKKTVELFLEEDVNSQVAPGKNEFIKRGGVRKQKRYLTDNMKNLHVKYCEKWDPISYSVFCKYRPFWIVSPSTNRDTCQCKLHSNMEILIKSLKKANIVAVNSASEVLKKICCNVFERKCLERQCQICKNKNINYKEFDNLKIIDYQEWICEKQSYQGKDGKEKFKRVTLKKKKQDAPRNVIKKFEDLLPAFLKHTLNITMQHSTIKDLKENLTPNEVLCHIDFSENYSLKYNEEIQSFHFGGSREQISLHTGVLYYVDVSTDKVCKSFCTMSKDIKHDASAIWAHLSPVFKLAQELVPHLTKIHFLSDSPSSQYRNRFIFYMISNLKEQIPNLELVSWNYQEAGHGKGAPDGIGAVVKRTADNHVRFGGDVATFEDFVEIVQKHIKNVELIVIAEEEISKKKFPKNIPTFKGTNKVHQALWCTSLPFDIVLRSLSCFACQDSYVPCMHSKHLGILNVGLCQETTLQSKASSNKEGSVLNINICQEASVQPTISFCNEDNAKKVGRNQQTSRYSTETFQCANIVENIGLCEEAKTVRPAFIPNDDDIVMKQLDSSEVAEIASANIDTPIHIDSPTIFNNIGDLRQFDILETEILGCESPKNVQNSPKVRILSNIPVNYQRLNTPKTQGFSSTEQREFEKFLQQRPVLHDFSDEEDTENSRFRYNTNDWVVVEYQIKKATHYFIGKIIEKTDNGAEYKIIFLRKGQGKSMKFGWPLISDEDVVSESRILQRLEEPVESRRGQFTFNNLPNLNFK